MPALEDQIADKRVLDLACGSGHFSRRLLKWGAGSVLGVDISSEMIEEPSLVRRIPVLTINVFLLSLEIYLTDWISDPMVDHSILSLVLGF